MCNCNRNVHWVTSVIGGTSTVNLVVSNSTNIGNLQPFRLLICSCQRANISTAPLPVTITVNGTAVPLLNQNGQQILSNQIPRCSFGKYIAATTATADESGATTQAAITAPYVILYNTPQSLANVR